MVLLRRMKVMVSSNSSAMPKGLHLPMSIRLSMLQLDFFPVWSFTGIFCYLLVLSGIVVGFKFGNGCGRLMRGVRH